MAKKKVASGGSSNGTAANLGFEAKLWLTADKLCNNMDAAKYKHIVLRLIFLKYISDAFEERHQKLLLEVSEGADVENPDESRADNVFWVPAEARWQHLQDNAKQPTIGKLIDEAMVAIERDNPGLKGILPKDFGQPALDKYRLGELIDVIGTIGLGDAENRSKDFSDFLGRVYEDFLTQFASPEGKNGGQFDTPRCVVRVLVEMLAPYKRRVYDPCCGSAGMFVQSERFVEEHGGRRCLTTTLCCYTGTLAKLVGDSRTARVLGLRRRLPDLHLAKLHRAFQQQDKRKFRDKPESPRVSKNRNFDSHHEEQPFDDRSRLGGVCRCVCRHEGLERPTSRATHSQGGITPNN